MLVKADPEVYRVYLMIGRKNKPIIYVKLKKVMHGCLRSTLLFYNKLVEGMDKDIFSGSI